MIQTNLDNQSLNLVGDIEKPANQTIEPANSMQYCTMTLDCC